MLQAFAGVIRSGVTVAQMIKSRSIPSSLAIARAFFAAMMPRLAEVSPGPTNRRSRMPVRLRIHSSEVSTMETKSSLRTIRAGRLLPVPLTTLLIFPFIPFSGHAEILYYFPDSAFPPALRGKARWRVIFGRGQYTSHDAMQTGLGYSPVRGVSTNKKAQRAVFSCQLSKLQLATDKFRLTNHLDIDLLTSIDYSASRFGGKLFSRGGIMVRSICSAAVLLTALAGVTGCTNPAYFAKQPDPATGMAVVTVPQSDWCQWYYKHEALDFIRSTYPSFKEKDIVVAGEVPRGQFIDGRQVGPDGKPIGNLNMNVDKEYQIVFRLPPKPMVTTVNGVQTTGVQGLNMTASTNGGMITPVSGVQNLSNTMPSTGQPYTFAACRRMEHPQPWVWPPTMGDYYSQGYGYQ